MEDKKKGEESRESTASPAVAVGLVGKVVEQYRKTREHAETYPYVWGSYILVYGGFGLWFTYRFRKLRKTEDRVRVLQAKLRKIFEEEEAAKSATSSGKLQKPPPPSDKAAPE